MIKDSYINQSQGVCESFCESNICSTWFGNSRRMIMRKQHCSSVVLECAFHNFPRMNAGPVNCAGEHLVKADDPVTVVQKEDGEHFMFKAG